MEPSRGTALVSSVVFVEELHLLVQLFLLGDVMVGVTDQDGL